MQSPSLEAIDIDWEKEKIEATSFGAPATCIENMTSFDDDNTKLIESTTTEEVSKLNDTVESFKSKSEDTKLPEKQEEITENSDIVTVSVTISNNEELSTNNDAIVTSSEGTVISNNDTSSMFDDILASIGKDYT